MNDKGVLLIVSGPSACGKGTVCSRMLEKDKTIFLSVSATTRAMRPGEVDGESYYFVTRAEFEKMIACGELLEYNNGYSGNYYGTPRKKVEEALSEGKNVLLEIEMNGAGNVKKVMPEAVSVFLAPPSKQALKERMLARGSENAEQISERLGKANAELARAEEYDYVVVNDDIEKCTDRILGILAAEKQKSQRQREFIKKLICE